MGFLIRGSRDHRELVKSPGFLADPQSVRTESAIDMPSLGEGAYFDPSLQLVVTGAKKPKDETPEQEQALGPKIRPAKPEDQLAFFSAEMDDVETAPFYKESRTEWIKKFNETVNSRKNLDTLPKWLKYLNSLQAGQYAHLGNRHLQGTIQDYAKNKMPKKVKQEYDNLTRAEKARMERKYLEEHGKELRDEARASGFDYDPQSNRYTDISKNLTDREKLKIKRQNIIEDVAETLNANPEAIAVIPKGKRYEAMRDPGKYIQIEDANFMNQEGGEGVMNSDAYEEIPIPGAEPRQEPLEQRQARVTGRPPEQMLSPEDVEVAVGVIQQQFPDLNDEEIETIWQLLARNDASVEEIMAELEQQGE